MKIDRHNYEEFFILYWDKELTAAQMLAVENFVQENSDLRDEFRLFGETRFTPETAVQIGDKNFLRNSTPINITNLEENLLNYIDDELSADKKKAIEKYAHLYPAVKKELELLQKTKLQPASEIIFADKSVLYRREEKVRVISMTWFRVAVAAVIIIIAGFASLRLLTNGTSEAVINPITQTDKQTITPANNENNQAAVVPKIDQQKSDALVKQSTAPDGSREKVTMKLPVENANTDNLAVNKIENKNNLPKEGSGLKNNSIQDANITDQTMAVVNMPNLKQKDFTSAEKYNSELTANPDVTILPGYALNLQEPAGNLSNNQKEKGGLKEFLRKTTRMFERRTKIQATTDDNKLLVGAFAVSLK